MGDDPYIAAARERIAELDRRLVETVNARIAIVAELKRHKAAHGLAFLDPDRETRMLAHLEETNPGPLSADGLRRFYGELLALVKREVA